MTSPERDALLVQDAGDLVSDFFQLVETPVLEIEVKPVETSKSGYFAETLTWLSEVDSPTSTNSMELIYQLQDMVLAQQLLCSCAAHTPLSESSNSFSLYSHLYDSPFQLDKMSPMGLDSHIGHEHCDCGGHYKDGKCENCGSLKHND